MDMGPDRSNLQAMKKNNKEFIWKYTQRWHEAVAQVNPSLLENQMINLFSNAFKASYFDYLVGGFAQYFSGLVVITERIDKSSGLERLLTRLRRKSFTGKRKET